MHFYIKKTEITKDATAIRKAWTVVGYEQYFRERDLYSSRKTLGSALLVGATLILGGEGVAGWPPVTVRDRERIT